ncbi:Oidioi.mRNA.OKI2018_I69.chr1.g322.t1.cds [Oikopleura dioica]|uniref:Oidioi.mRNA.OKI2018_I69.chr1.g322.t1.cds n=1 Tax=Oikopleura dioica TaxID=34765 RepID=A0ABN7SJH5_OIKDI|nr:Oidioi.mRNA.OKI2018_I69.chr1.g322.t1.cds [Oikopleura dioica]
MTFCPAPFLDINFGARELFHGSCFVLFPKVDFFTASENCSKINGTLPVFLAHEKNWFLKASLSAPRKKDLGLEKLWLGYSDHEDEGNWVDRHGNALEIDNWGSWEGEPLPDNDVFESETQDFLVVNLQQQPTKLDDDFKIRERYSFCQTHREDPKAIRAPVDFPPKIGRFENWEKIEEFRSSMAVMSAVFLSLESSEDITKMLKVQEALEIQLSNNKGVEIEEIFKEISRENGTDFLNLIAFIGQKSGVEDSDLMKAIMTNENVDLEAFSEELKETQDENFHLIQSENQTEENFDPHQNQIEEEAIYPQESSFEIIAGCRTPFVPISDSSCGHILPADNKENVENTCSKLHNSTLPMPTTFEENYALSSFMPVNNNTGFNEKFWLGVHLDDGKWRRMDGKSIQFLLWAAMPDFDEEKRCVSVNNDSLPLWAPENCSNLIMGLCILPRENSTILEPTISSQIINYDVSKHPSIEISFKIDADINFNFNLNEKNIESSSSSTSTKISSAILLLFIFFIMCE